MKKLILFVGKQTFEQKLKLALYNANEKVQSSCTCLCLGIDRYI